MSPNFDFESQRGEHVTNMTLRGQPYIANFIFTSCRTVCPMLTAKMVQLQRRLPGAPLRFVSFSVDPANDTKEALAAYAAKWNGEEPRWSLLVTSPTGLAEIAQGFHIVATKNPDEKGVDPIIHSSVFLLVDRDGVVRGVYDSEHREEMLALIRDAQILVRTPVSPPTPAKTGAELYASLSCGACHDYPALAPPLGGLDGKRREMADSSYAVADKEYIRRSIIAPEERRVKGYSLKMPTYDGLLTSAELDMLVDYVLTMKPSAEPEEEAATAIDPVCGMEVRADSHAFSATHKNQKYYFCSKGCLHAFQKSPDKILDPKHKKAMPH